MAGTNQFARNWGFVSEEAQRRLANSTVCIAGVGGVGGRVATQLARIGVGKLRIADPDTFSLSNLNRQEGAYHSTLGQSKAEVIAALCLDINPAIKIDIFPEGVTKANIHAFVTGGDMVVEASDYLVPEIGVMIARAARRHKMMLVMGIEIGYGATVTRFTPGGYEYERYLGIPLQATLEQISDGSYTPDITKLLPHLPNYGDIAVLRRIQNEALDAPVIAPAVDICAALITTQVVGHVTGFRLPPAAPALMHTDIREGRIRIIRRRAIHQLGSFIANQANGWLGRTDKISRSS